MDAIEFRYIIETEALKKSFPNIGPEQIKLLEENLEEGLKLKDIKDSYRHWDMNSKFHLLLCSFCGNEFFCDTLKILMRKCFRGANYYFQDGFVNNVHREDSTRHKLIIEYIKEHDYEKTLAMLKEDIGQIKITVPLINGI